MIQVSDHNSEWYTLKESSRLTGKSINALRILIYRKKLDKIKKVSNIGKKDIWLIHKDSLSQIEVKNTSLNGIQENTFLNTIPDDIQNTIQNTIPLEYFDGKLNEWENIRSQWFQERDQLQAGLMMYRYKFEEAEKQLKLLPAPVETVTLKLEELERKLQEKEAVLSEQETRLQEKEAELQRERSLPWWKKMFRR